MVLVFKILQADRLRAYHCKLLSVLQQVVDLEQVLSVLHLPTGSFKVVPQVLCLFSQGLDNAWQCGKGGAAAQAAETL